LPRSRNTLHRSVMRGTALVMLRPLDLRTNSVRARGRVGELAEVGDPAASDHVRALAGLRYGVRWRVVENDPVEGVFLDGVAENLIAGRRAGVSDDVHAHMIPQACERADARANDRVPQPPRSADGVRGRVLDVDSDRERVPRSSGGRRGEQLGP